MFLGKTAFAGGARWLDRWCDSRVAKFSGHTSQGTMKVTAIFALFGHSIDAGRGTAFPRLIPRGVLDVSGTAGKSASSKAYGVAILRSRSTMCGGVLV